MRTPSRRWHRKTANAPERRSLNAGTVLFAGITLLVIALALRSASVNRLVRSRLLTSCVLFGASTLAAALAAYAPLPLEVARQIRTFDPLVLAFGVATLVVVIAINPWREDRVPDRFPTIVQDAIVIAVFALVAILFMQEKILATTAVGAVVVGLALQDTLGNLFSGLAIQIEKPFRVGQWVTIGGTDGLVTEVTWRATKMRTKAGNFVVMPNSVVAKDTITNYSEPTLETCLEVDVGASYDTPPNAVKAVIGQALQDEPLLVRGRQPEVLIADFSASAITYRVRVWITDFGADFRTRDRVRSRIYYAFHRHGIAIPYPIQVQYQQDALPAPPAEPPPRATLDSVEILAPLTDAERAQLLQASRPQLFAAGEAVVREGDEGSSMYVVSRGEAAVTIASADGEVARLREGAFFGEMSLLTGDPRTATVIAVTDCELLEIRAEAFRAVVLADPAVVERVTAAVASRRAGLELHRATRGQEAETLEAPLTFLARVRQFLRLSTPK
jgi:small-conductance mechanosensitive channel/CRP-like cAMP-binding protein